MTGCLDGRSTNHRVGWGLGFSLHYQNKPRARDSSVVFTNLHLLQGGVVGPCIRKVDLLGVMKFALSRHEIVSGFHVGGQ